MKRFYAQEHVLRVVLFVFTLFSSVLAFAQVSNSFEGLTTEQNCGNSDCDYFDDDITSHQLMDQVNNGVDRVAIPVSQVGSGTTLGFSSFFSATGANFSTGFQDGDNFGVAGNAQLSNDIGVNAQDGAQAFIIEDVDGEVTVTFDPVFLNGTTSPDVSLYYFIDESGYETPDFLNIRVEIDMCAAATTVTLLNTSGQDIDDLAIEESWNQLMADLTPYIDCRATLLISASSNSASEQFAIDNIVFSEGSLLPPAGDVCPTVGSVAAGTNPVCLGETFDVTASGLADLAMADNNEQNFGVDFVIFPAATADPYAGGTSLGTVAFADLGGGGTTATLSGASLEAGGSYSLYAILSPAPTDPTCRPSAVTTLTVQGTSPEITGDRVQKLSGVLQDLEATNGGGTWAFTTDGNPDGMGMIDNESANPALLMGTAGQAYDVVYTINDANCGASSDTVTVIFLSETDLALGDIAFTGYRADGTDAFSFVTLTEINAGTTISFTENGWLSAGGFRSGENTVSIEFCNAYPCGSEFFLEFNASPAVLDADGETAATVTGSNLAISVSGDQIFAYQGTEPSAGNEDNFLAAIQMNGAWDLDAVNTTTSAEPQIFIDNPGNSLDIDPEVDNAVFDCANLPADADEAANRAAINDPANWSTSNVDDLTLPSGCAFSCFDPCVDDLVAPVVTCTEFTNSFEGCPNFLGPNTPNFEWFPLPANGMFQSAVGGSFITTIDLSTCITDNCSEIGEIEVTLGRSFEEDRMGDSVTLVNVLIFRDAALNEATDSVYVRVTIKDTEAPEAVCQNISVFLDADGNASITPADVDGGSTDNCAIDSLAISVDAFTCDQVGIMADTVVGADVNGVLTVTDVNGNQTNCTYRIFVLDTITPVVTCLIDSVYLDADGLGGYAELDLFEATDNCDVDFAPFDQAFPVDCSDVGTDILYDITVSDVNGNTAPTCQAIVRVLDTIAPVLVCQDITVDLDENGMSTLDEPMLYDSLIVSETDACPISGGAVNGVFVPSCDNIGPNMVGNFSDDASDNRSECFVTVIVRDTFAPVIMATDTILYLDENGEATLSITDFEDTVSDNCGEATVTDIFRVPATASLGADAGAEKGFEAKSQDQTLTFTCDDLGNINLEVEVVAQDVNGNESRDTIMVTVLDTITPDVTCIDLEIFLDENGTGEYQTTDLFTGTDNCEIDFAPFDFVVPVFCEDIGTIEENFSVFDVNGNDTTCMVTITVADTTRPALECMDVTVFIDEMGNASVTDTSAAIVSLSDNCTDSAAITIALVAPVLGCDGATGTATLTATDENDNVATCTIGLEPVDILPPTAVCMDITVELDEQGNGSLVSADDTSSLIDGGSTDNCASEGLTFMESVTEFTCDDLGENTVTLTVTDASGLTVTCDAIVTVEDNIAPVATVTVDPLMINLTDAEPEMTVDFPAFVTATDNCDDELDFEADRDLTFTGTDIGSGSFTVTVTDDSGNPTTVTINFVVTFDQPNLACIGDINLTLNDECQGLLIPSMVLTGNTALNEFFDFDIVVQDSDPSNGPIIDGCGEFVYMISQRSDVAGPATLGFTGAYAPDQWFSAPFGAGDLFNNNTDEQIVTIDHTATTLEMTTFATVFSTGSQFGAQSSIQFGEMATVSFDYDFNGVDAFFDQAFSLTTFEGEVVDIGFNTITEEGGNVSFDVQPGYALIIQLRDDGFQPFAGPAPSVLTITGFEVAPMAADNPLDLDFESCWGIVRAEDKTPPAVVNQIAPIDLLCVDLDDNQVNTLPNNVDRCYEVFSATGATVPGTMATALRNALSAEVGNSAAIVPTFTDGCTERLEVCVTESIAFDDEDPQCNDVVLTRTFTATEIAVCPSASGESNGSTVSSYVITFSRPSLDDLDADNIEDVAEYDECGVTTGTIAEIMASYPAPRATDFPFLVVGDRSFPLMDGEAVCNIGVTFADGQPIITCPNTYKFVRTYTVIDWCDPSDVRTFTQVVKVGDTEAPTFSGPTQDRDFDGVVDGDLIFSTNAGNQCAAYIVLDGPGVSATDNCEGAITITAQIYPGGDLTASPIGPFVVDLTDGNAEVTSPIPVGTHLLRYTYEDVCGNADFSDFEFTVEDGTAPVAICEDGLNISITAGSQGGGASTGIAILTPEMIDAGSYDDCSGITLEIARVNGNNVATEAYDQELVLTCADLGIVRVGLKVTDAEGNMNFCWLDVLVEDKNAPTCLPPGPVALTCVEYLAAGLPADINEASEDELNALFGSAVGIDNCEVTISSTVSGGVNSCGVGSLMRSFVATDGEGFVDDDNCEQFIEIRGVFDYRITFPTDEVFDECVDPDFNQLGAEEFACDLITTNVTMDTIAAVNAPDACYTLRVNYDVINFCEYNQLGECYRIPRDGDGIRNPDTQLLYLNVIPNNTANTGDDIAFLSRFTDRNYNPGAPQRDQLVDDGDDNDGSDDDNSNDSEEQQAANGVGFAYAQDDSRGYFCYVQFVDVYDEVAPTIEGDEPEECFAGTSADCTAEVELTFTADDNCTTPVVTVELDADYNPAFGFIPVSPASAGVSVSVSNDGINYTVNASNVPVGNHAIRIRANDGCGNFDSEIIEFCVEGDKAPTPICIQTLTVTLMPDGNGGGMAEIWASDFIASDVEDCFGNVIDKYSIYTEEEAGAAGFEPQVGDLGLDFTCDDYNGLGEDNTVPVRVYAIADNGTADYCSVIVDVQAFQEGVCGDGGGGGNLAGTILTQDEAPIVNVEVSLSDDGDMDRMVMTAANGAYTFGDLPQNVDYTVQPTYGVGVNLSNVTVADVNLMGNVILGIDQFATPYDYLAADTDRDQQLTVGDMVTTQRIILGLEDNFAISNWGFVPADVDVSNPYSEAFPEVFNANDLVGTVVADFVGYELGNVEAANRSSASIEVEDAQLEAGQTHTLTIAAGDLLGFQGTLELAAGLEVMDVRYDGAGGVNLREVASGAIPMMFLADGVVEVDVRATAAGQLSELVTMTSGVTIAEGVNANGTAGPLSLAFVTSSAPATAPKLFQNTPNPVTEVTTIRFRLTDAGPAVLTLRDAAGRLLREQKIDGIAGMNRVELTDLNASGVISYTLTAGDFSATRKMVVVR